MTRLIGPRQVGSEKRREDFERRLQLNEQHLEAGLGCRGWSIFTQEILEHDTEWEWDMMDMTDMMDMMDMTDMMDMGCPWLPEDLDVYHCLPTIK